LTAMAATDSKFD